LSFLLHVTDAAFQIAITFTGLVAVGYRSPLGAPKRDCLKMMGIVMKKLALLATALAMVSGSALAADMAVKAVKAPPPAPFDPWDIAFGSALMNDYVFRGITQSNHKPSVAAYFEPRYNVNKDLQLYIGTAGESISFPNRAAAEIDIYGGIRPTIGMFAFDFGVWGYLYPGGTCYNANAIPGSGIPGSDASCAASPAGNSDPITLGLPINGNFAKKSASFYEGYAKVNVTLNDQFTVGATEYYSPNFLNLGAWGNYASVTGKWTAPSTTFGASGVGMYISGEFGRQWLGTSDSFYGTPAFPNGIPEPSYNTWNVGIGFTYKVFTLDLRYSDTDLSKGACNAFTSDYTAKFASIGSVSGINPGGFESNWCGATGIAKLSADLTAMTNLK
jgi:uncharacterized protein (TIGR02001 family)